mmetsp:Transcript_37580/g.86780  ORF Transcript_37580/g.86780 Transcript_37580/m.86780 type:complete len:84 (-) Transcript_37580:26-277(-)
MIRQAPAASILQGRMMSKLLRSIEIMPAFETLTFRSVPVRVLWYSSARMSTKAAQKAILAPNVREKKAVRSVLALTSPDTDAR